MMAVKMNGAVPQPSAPEDAGSHDNSDLAAMPGRGQHKPDFDGIDWSKAAPGWGSLLTGLFLPSLALGVLVVCIDLGLGWFLERWAGGLSVSPLLLAAIMLPPALICAFVCCKLFLYLKDTRTSVARCRKRQSGVSLD
jgi:hypothetical protein